MNVTTRVRSVVADGTLVARRRARTDAGMLTATAVLLAALVLVALLAPRLVSTVADDGARDVVDRGRPGTDVVVSVTATVPPIAGVRPAQALEDLRRDRATVVDGLPADLRGDLADPSVVSTTPTWGAIIPAGTVVMRLAHVLGHETGDDSAPVRWVAGRAPALLPDVEQPEGVPLGQLRRSVEVGVSTAAAARLDLAPGDTVEVRTTTVSRLTAVIVGTYEVTDPTDTTWTELPDLVGATDAPPGSPAIAAAGLLVSDASLPDLMVAMQASAVATHMRFETLPEHVTAAHGRTLAASVAALRTDPTPLRLADARQPVIVTGLDDALRTYDRRLAGATAQASVLLLGIVAVGALTLLLAARLLVDRRTTGYRLERARGASVASVGWRGLLETVPLTTFACAVAVGGLALVLPTVAGPWWPGAAVAAVGVLATAVLAGRLVRGSWTGRRVPANRADRDRLAARQRSRRLVAELTLLAVAVGALVSVRARGLVASSTGGVDWLLAASPVLLAAAATVLAARVLPPLLRRLRTTASRGRALAGLVATARAERGSRTAVPLLTVTVALALVVFSGITVSTVDRGQQRAADLVVGGDVRIDGPVSDAVLDELRTQPGVSEVVGSRTWVARTFGVGSGVRADLLAVDAEAFARLRAAQGTPQPELATLTATGPAGKVPALVSPSLERVAEAFDQQVWTTDSYVPLEVRGTTSLVGTDGRPVVVVDRTALDAVLESDATADRTWLLGEGAAAASADLGVATLPGVTVLSRDHWLETWNESPLTTGLRTLLLVAQVTLALLAVVALVLTVVATARDRQRTLHVLRTLGLDAGTARRLSAGEILPLAVTALVAGSAIGLVVPWLLTTSLGLTALTGEPDGTRVAVGWQPFALAAAALAVGLWAAVEIEARARRGDDLALGIREAER